jgi:hypothetical protein
LHGHAWVECEAVGGRLVAMVSAGQLAGILAESVAVCSVFGAYGCQWMVSILIKHAQRAMAG